MIAPRRQAEVVSTAEARKLLPGILKEFRERGDRAAPIFMGAHRKLDAVLLPYESYEELLDLMDEVAVAAEVEARLSRPQKTIPLEDVLEEMGYDDLVDELKR